MKQDNLSKFSWYLETSLSFEHLYHCYPNPVIVTSMISSIRIFHSWPVVTAIVSRTLFFQIDWTSSYKKSFPIQPCGKPWQIGHWVESFPEWNRYTKWKLMNDLYRNFIQTASLRKLSWTVHWSIFCTLDQCVWVVSRLSLVHCEHSCTRNGIRVRSTLTLVLHFQSQRTSQR